MEELFSLYEEPIKLIVTSIVIIIGWIIVHYFTSRRDRRNKKREISTNHLISTYQILTHEISARLSTKEVNEKIEKVITDIQLFGSLEQIKMTLEIREKLLKSEDANLDSLINSLRNDLRKELNLKKVEGNVHWVRFQ